MRKPTLVLGIALGISVLVNALTLLELSKHRGNGKARPESTPREAVPAPLSEAEVRLPEGSRDLEPILAELRRLSREVAALRDSRPADSAVVPVPSSTRDTGPIASDPEVARLLEEQEALQKLWKDLGRLLTLRGQLSDERHRELVLKTTTEFLGFDSHTSASFGSASLNMTQDLARARETMQNGYKSLPRDKENSEAYKQQYRAIQDSFNRERDTALARLDPYFATDPRHQQFKTNLQTWVYYLDPKSGRDGWKGER